MEIDSFIHTGDWHIFDRHKYSIDGSRLKQIMDNAYEVLDCAIENEIPLIIHTGDVFNVHNPNERLINEFSGWVRKAAENNIMIRVIVGNHDTNGVNHSLEGISNIAQVTDQNLFKVFGNESYMEEFDNVVFFYVPWVKNIQKAVNDSMKFVDEIKRNILVVHTPVNGAWATPKYKYESKDGSVSFVNDWDYVALGDFHMAQQVGKNAFYCGSIAKLTWNEREDVKSFNYVELGDSLSVNLVPLVDIEFIETKFIPHEMMVVDMVDEILEIDGKPVKDGFIKLFVDNIGDEVFDFKRALLKGGAKQVYIKELEKGEVLESEDISLDLDPESAVKKFCKDKEMLEYGLKTLKDVMS